MKKQELEALRRLEAALLEQPSDEVSADDPETSDDQWTEFSSADYDIYNTDDTDVDMAAYSEEVHQGSRQSPILSFLIVLLLLLLAAFIWIMAKQLGVV